MKTNITAGEAEIRMFRAWNWFMETEPKEVGGRNPRWEIFKMLRDRYRPHRLPLAHRVECVLCGMSGVKLSDGTERGIMDNWDKAQA